jgi:Family of unknown function (DUF5989)
MSMVEQMTARAAIVGEVFSFLWQQKLWWLIPLAAIIFLLGLLFAIAQISSVAPWMYPL